jgi:hypothetical protein
LNVDIEGIPKYGRGFIESKKDCAAYTVHSPFHYPILYWDCGYPQKEMGFDIYILIPLDDT